MDDTRVKIKYDTYDDLHSNKIRDRYGPFQEAMLTPLADWNAKPFTAFEIGVGTGNTALGFLGAFSGLELTCLDIDSEALRISSQKLQQYIERVRFAREDIFSYSPKERFDVVYSALTFHNFSPEQQLEFLKKARGLLKNGGLYIGCEFMLHEGDDENTRQWAEDYELLRQKFKGKDYEFWFEHHKKFHEPNFQKISWYKQRIIELGFKEMNIVRRENFYCTFYMAAKQ